MKMLLSNNQSANSNNIDILFLSYQIGKDLISDSTHHQRVSREQGTLKREKRRVLRYELSGGQLATYIKILKDRQAISSLDLYPKEIVIDVCKI